MSWLTQEEQEILRQVKAFTLPVREILEELRRIRWENAEQYSALKKELDLVLHSVVHPPPTGFIVDEATVNQPTGEEVMKATGHNVELQILPNGTVRFTFVPTPAGSVLPAGTPALSYTSSDPALAVAVDPANNADGFGLVALGTPNLPAGSTGVTGIVVTGQTTLPGATSPISGTADPVDIIPAPNLPTGFAVTESSI